MSVESGNTIQDLVTTNPQLIDPVYAGANHFWLIKSVLKHVFPGAGGNGFSTPITASEVEINRLVGVTSSVQTQINSANSAAAAAQTTANTALARILPVTTHAGSVINVALGNP